MIRTFYAACACEYQYDGLQQSHRPIAGNYFKYVWSKSNACKIAQS